MKKIKNILLLLIILLVIIIITILIILQNMSKKDNKKYSPKEDNTDSNIIYDSGENDEMIDDLEEQINTKLNYESDRQNFYAIEEITKDYIYTISNKNQENLKAILAPSYIEKYGITNVDDLNIVEVPSIEEENGYYNIRILEMLSGQINEYKKIYIVKGKGRIQNTNKKFDIKVLFEVDENKKTYNVYPYKYIKDNGLNNLEVNSSILQYFNTEEIEDRTYNKFDYSNVDDRKMANNYFYDFKEILLNYKDEIYGKIEPEYFNKRFGNIENLNYYLYNNQKVLSTMEIDKYKVIPYDNYVDYVCIDKYENTYIFRQYAVMRYSVLLDNYTIISQEDLEEYNSLEKAPKAINKAYTFIKQVNTKDYNSIYKLLDKNFRENKYKTLSSLEQDFKQNLYPITKIEIKDYDTDTYEYCVFNCKVTNVENEEESKNMTLIINIQEGTNYTMSFSFSN